MRKTKPYNSLMKTNTSYRGHSRRSSEGFLSVLPEIFPTSRCAFAVANLILQSRKCLTPPVQTGNEPFNEWLHDFSPVHPERSGEVAVCWARTQPQYNQNVSCPQITKSMLCMFFLPICSDFICSRVCTGSAPQRLERQLMTRFSAACQCPSRLHFVTCVALLKTQEVKRGLFFCLVFWRDLIAE